MNAQEFEEAVRQLLRLQAKVYVFPKDSADRKRAWEEYDAHEKKVQQVVDIAMAQRPKDARPHSDREEFFLRVNDLLKERRYMRQNKCTEMSKVWKIEKDLRKYLQKWEEQRREQRRKDLDKQQYKLDFQ